MLFCTYLNQKICFLFFFNQDSTTNQLLPALLRQPFGIIAMELNDGGMRRVRELGGHQLFVILQQSEAEGQRISLAVQHI